MKIIIEKKSRRVPTASRHVSNDHWLEQPFYTVTNYNVFVNETKKDNLLGEFATLGEAEKLAEVLQRTEKAEVITSWARAYRVTTTVHAHSESEALDRLCGDDLEARKAATVVTV